MPYYEQRYGWTNEAAHLEIDPTDVPRVSMRELATALKVLADESVPLTQASRWSDEDFRRVEQFFWQRCVRDRQRKTATLVRLRGLIAVSRARLLQALIARNGTAGALCLVDVAASIRFNAQVGFSPVKVSWFVMAALKEIDQRVDLFEAVAGSVAPDLLRVDAARFPAEVMRRRRRV